MRDNFTERIKSILASRVAYRCSFPGCNRITIGPGHQGNEHVILIGEAAHIFSAAPNGPRNNPNLTSEQRSSVNNGIWMCKSHARLIDIDEVNYSAETLLKWKIDAENFVRERLETLEKETLPIPLTLVMLNVNLIIQTRWTYVDEQTWKFQIYNFIEGNIAQLREYINGFLSKLDPHKYIVVESQGDGRLLSSVSVNIQNEEYILICKLMPKIKRTNPHEIGRDLAIGDDGDLVLADNDLRMIHGVECALQIIKMTLSSEFGWWMNPSLGSYFNTFYKRYSQNEQLFNSIAKLEIVRLLTVPPIKSLFDKNDPKPELSFINRINWVKVPKYDRTKPFLPLKISLEWGNYETWEGEIRIPFEFKGIPDPSNNAMW